MNMKNSIVIRKGLLADASINQMIDAKMALKTELRASHARLVFLRQGRAPSVDMVENEICALKGRLRYVSDRLIKQGATHA